MSVAERAFEVIKAVFVYQDTMKAIREDMAALASDVGALGRAHAGLAERIARLEGIIEGAAIANVRQPRIEG